MGAVCAVSEVDPVLRLDARHEAGIAGDVGQEEVSLACGGLRPARIRSDCLCREAMIAAVNPGEKVYHPTLVRTHGSGWRTPSGPRHDRHRRRSLAPCPHRT